MWIPCHYVLCNKDCVLFAFRHFPTLMFSCFSFRPDLIDFTYVRNSKPHDRLEYAFTVAERDLGVHRLLDPEGNNSTFTFLVAF